MSRFSHRAIGAGHAAVLGVVLIASIAAVPGTAQASGRNRSLSINTKGDEPVVDCSQVNVRFGGNKSPLPTARAEKRFTLSKSATPLLELHLRENGGMSIVGGEGSDYAVTACLVAGAGSESDAAAILDDVAVGLDGGRLAVEGPDDSDWIVYLIVRAPKEAALDLLAMNAPIGLREVSGTIKARTENGPISLERCTGTIDVEARNGPVSMQFGGGRQRLQVENGPLAITLEGRRYEGEGIDAHAENGPVSLKFPEAYESGVRVTLSEHSPLSCSSGGCEHVGRQGSDGSRSLDFGATRPIIRVSAENGPVQIDNGGARGKGFI
jgi:hypothetical protein